MKKIIILIASFILLLLILIFIHFTRHAAELSIPITLSSYVPDEKTAIKIAEVIGDNIFGKNLNDYKPFKARLVNDSIWHVYGIPKKTWLEIQVGGDPEFEIQKKDGKILNIRINR